MPKNFTLVPEMFDPGHYEVPVFLAEGSETELAGVGVVEIVDLDMSATINIDEKILKKMGYSCIFVEEDNPLELNKKYKLVIRRDSSVRIPLVMWTNGERRVLGIAEITCPLNEGERQKLSNTELIAKAFDDPHDDQGLPIYPEWVLIEPRNVLRPKFRKKSDEGNHPMTDGMPLKIWAEKVETQVEATRKALGGPFEMNVKHASIPLVLKQGHHEECVGNAEIDFSHGRPQIGGVIRDLGIFEELDVEVVLDTYMFGGVKRSRIVLAKRNDVDEDS